MVLEPKRLSGVNAQSLKEESQAGSWSPISCQKVLTDGSLRSKQKHTRDKQSTLNTYDSQKEGKEISAE